MRRIRGFTLLEVMATLAVLGVLVAVALPGIQGLRQKAEDLESARSVYDVLTEARNLARTRGWCLHVTAQNGNELKLSTNQTSACPGGEPTLRTATFNRVTLTSGWEVTFQTDGSAVVPAGNLSAATAYGTYDYKVFPSTGIIRRN